MAQPRKLTKAPPIEAVVDFRVKLAKVDLSLLDSLKQGCAGRYPRWEPRRILRGGFELVEGRGASQKLEEARHGFVLRSEDGRDVVQTRMQSFYRPVPAVRV